MFLYSTSYIVFIEKQLLIICIYFIFSLKSVKFITSIFSFQFQVEELPVNDVIASNLVFQAWPKKWIGSKSVIQQPKEGAIIVGGYLQGGPHEDGPQQQDVLLGVRACVFFTRIHDNDITIILGYLHLSHLRTIYSMILYASCVLDLYLVDYLTCTILSSKMDLLITY